jgi:hypothetical protein
MLSLGSFHLSNIDGYFENLKDIQRIKYLHFALGKYQYQFPKFEYLFGHAYFLNTMFLIYSLFVIEITKKIDDNKISDDNNAKNKNDNQNQILIENNGNDSNLKECLISDHTSSAFNDVFHNKRTSSINDEDEDEDDKIKNDYINSKVNTNRIFSEDNNLEDIYEENVSEVNDNSLLFLKLLLKNFFYI